MNFDSFVNMITPMTCIMSVESSEPDSYGEIRIVTGNKAYIDSIETVDESMPQMMVNKFIPNSLYQTYFPKDLNFEDFCYRAAVLKTPMHTYVHPERYDFWFNLFMIPLGSEGNIHYCTYTQVITKNADSAEMANNLSSDTASKVLNTCIKLRGTRDFKKTITEVISDIRIMCDAQHCVLLAYDAVKRECEVLSEARADGDYVGDMTDLANQEGFTDLVATWDHTIGGSNCLIVKNLADMEFVKEKNSEWYDSLMSYEVTSIVLFPLKYGDETLGYIWATNFNSENTVKIKETLELTTFFLGSELSNHKLLERLKVLSTIDMLTGLLNRNEMNNRVDSLRCPDSPVVNNIGIVFADLNGLKRVNDNEGHAAGDLLLRNGASVLRNSFIGDEIYRAGGDEFMIFITDTNEEEIKKKCELVKENSLKFPNVSFAVGYAFDKDSSNIVDILKVADERMYDDKADFYKIHPELKR